MKLYAVVLLSSAISTTSFTATTNSLVQRSISTSLNAEIRGPTEKAEVLEFGWDGTTALGGAVDDSKPARMLDQIRASGETQSEACQLFNANLGECRVGFLFFNLGQFSFVRISQKNGLYLPQFLLLKFDE